MRRITSLILHDSSIKINIQDVIRDKQKFIEILRRNKLWFRITSYAVVGDVIRIDSSKIIEPNRVIDENEECLEANEDLCVLYMGDKLTSIRIYEMKCKEKPYIFIEDSDGNVDNLYDKLVLLKAIYGKDIKYKSSSGQQVIEYDNFNSVISHNCYELVTRRKE